MKIYDLSPLAAMMTGKGGLGKAIRQGFGGMLPQAIARNAYADEEEAERRRLAEEAAASGMKKGGSAKAKGWGKARSARAAKVY